MTARLAFAALVALAVSLACWGAMDAAARYIAATLAPSSEGQTPSPSGFARPNGRPSLCEESQGGGCRRPAPEGQNK